MKRALYSDLQKKIIAIILVVSLTPLILLGAYIYYQFATMYKNKVEEQIKYRATAQAETIDLFLKERLAILGTVADTHAFSELVNGDKLAHIFEVINLRAGAFVDLGVIDSAGQHQAYIGPYDLRGYNYYQQPWFAEVMSKGLYISDVYLGYRQLPHFIIAIRRQDGGNNWILRATIDPDVFWNLIRAAQVGNSGDAFVINPEGVYQTASRFGGKILSPSGLNTSLFGGSTTFMEARSASGEQRLYAGGWLKQKKWLLVISQETAGEMSGLFTTRNVEIVIILCGILAIILSTIFTTRLTIRRLRATDTQMDALNAQLIQSDKLAALGKLAAGVAHEINNPLAVILQKTGWIEDLLQEEEFAKSKNYAEFYQSVKKIEEHVERARKVVHSMLGYARKMEPRLEDVDVNETIKQTIGLLENFARLNNIEIKSVLAEDIPILASDQAQLQQVFLNLLSNAIDATGKDGQIVIQSRRLNTHIGISVIDNGRGIPEPLQKRVFDPFFTTKETGKGTGLGLWISYNIIEKMGGTISLKSKEGKGSTFTVEIPIVIPEKK